MSDMNSPFIAAFTVFCYLSASGLIAARLFSRAASEQIPRLAGLGPVLVGLWGQAWLLYQGMHLGDGGINLGFSNAFSLVSWAVLVLILFSALSKPVESLAILPLPLAALAVVIEATVPSSHLFPPDASWALRMHALFSLLGYRRWCWRSRTTTCTVTTPAASFAACRHCRPWRPCCSR